MLIINIKKKIYIYIFKCKILQTLIGEMRLLHSFAFHNNDDHCLKTTTTQTFF